MSLENVGDEELAALHLSVLEEIRRREHQRRASLKRSFKIGDIVVFRNAHTGYLPARGTVVKICVKNVRIRRNGRICVVDILDCRQEEDFYLRVHI